MQKLSENEYLFTLRVGHRGPPGQDLRPDLRRGPGRDHGRRPRGRVACETLVNTGLVVVSGEITTSCYVDIPKIARETIRKIGYDDPHYGFDHEACAVLTAIDEQSADIAQGVDQAYERRTDPSDEDELDSAALATRG